MNKVILMGRFVKDCEVKYTNSGTCVATFTLAVDRRKSKNDNSNQPTADFINCVAWQKTAETIGNYTKKGVKVLVEGRLQVRSYDGQDGKKRFVTEVIVDNFEFCESKKTQEQTNNSNFAGQSIQDEDVPF